MSYSPRRGMSNMMDTLNGDNIQCFFVPINMDKETFKIEYKVTRRKFDFEQKLPYKSCAYDYSDTFIIFDYESDDFEFNSPWAYIIENGVCTYYAPVEALTDSYPIVLVVNKYGIPLNIKKISDFKRLRNDFIELNSKLNKIPTRNTAKEEIHTNFQFKWYNLKQLNQVYSNIVGILISIYAINREFKIKEIFKKYCDKHGLDCKKELLEYCQWADLHGIEVRINELEDVLL